MPPHHPILGHLQYMAGIMSELPKDIHGHVLPHQIKLKLPDLGPIFYVDTWPFGYPMLVITAPDQAYQITQAHSLPKFHALRDYMRPMTGGNDMITMEGKEWKKWRRVFQPGFKSGHLMTLVPKIVDEMSIFCNILRDLARKQEIFLMDQVATNLSLDIIGRVALYLHSRPWGLATSLTLYRDVDLNAQHSRSEFMNAMRNQVRWLSFGSEANPIERYHPFRPVMRWWNDRKMRRYISHQLDLRLKSRAGHVELEGQKCVKTIVDLALETCQHESILGKPSSTLDAVFRDYAVSQIRALVFAGHDSTGSAICYAFHLLSINPSARKLLVSEHDRVLGSDCTEASSTISANPHLLNQLPYTLAVVKESLRLYPPASSTRSGKPGHSITDPSGRLFPTQDLLVWSNVYGIHRDPNIWPESDKFLPERWLVEEGDRFFPQKGAFRPFEFGPRSCIGQELAMLELKLVLVMTARTFDVKSVYDEWDRLNSTSGTKTINGDKAYQILFGAAHPRDGLPCRVSLAIA